MGNGQKSRGGASGRPAGKSDREREELRRRRRAYYESLSPEEKQAYRERRIRRRKIRQLKKMAFSGAIMLGLIVISVVGVLLQQRGKKAPRRRPARRPRGNRRDPSRLRRRRIGWYRI